MSERPLEDQTITYDKKECKCFSPKAIKAQYPNGGYKVIGEISHKVGTNKELEVHVDECTLYVQPVRTYKSPGYKISGYIWSEEQQGYIVVKKSTAVPIVLTVIFIIAIGVIIGILIAAFVGKSSGPTLDPNASEYEATIKRTEGMDSSTILIPGFDDLNMYTGKDELYVALLNPKENPCYFQYDVILEKTGEILFSTKLIPPGSAVKTIKLPRSFEKGIYPVTIKINTYDLNDTTKMLNGGQAKTKIVVYDKA